MRPASPTNSVAALLFALPLLAAAQVPAYIDAHVHPISGSLEEPLALMQSTAIRAMVLMPPPQVSGMRRMWDIEAIAASAREHPARFAFLGGGGTLNPMIHDAAAAGRVDPELRRRFEARAREILALGARGFGEMSPHHLSHMAGHPYESAPPDHPLFLLLADIAGEHGVVIDLHLDLVPAAIPRPAHVPSSNPPTLAANLQGFERLLAHNRKARIIWAHAGSDPLGFFTPQVVRELLGRHPNLHLSLRAAVAGAPVRNKLFAEDGSLDPAWLALFSDFAERFVLGGDQFFAAGMGGSGGGGPGMEFARRGPLQRRAQVLLLEQLPPALAARIGHENATRLYGLP